MRIKREELKRCQTMEGRQHEEGRKERQKERESIRGVKEADQREVATHVEATTTQESVHRIKKQEKEKGNIMVTHHRDNGQNGIQDSDRDNGKTGGQEKVKDLEKAKERALTE